jgi:hypothetical protein
VAVELLERVRLDQTSWQPIARVNWAGRHRDDNRLLLGWLDVLVELEEGGWLAWLLSGVSEMSWSKRDRTLRFKPDSGGGSCARGVREAAWHTSSTASFELKKCCRSRKADAQIRTGDPFITSEVLYQLSYVGEAPRV